MNDDLQDRDNQIQDIQYENVTLQSQRYVYKEQLQKCQHTIIHLKTRYVDHVRAAANHPGTRQQDTGHPV